jgi:putative transposase
MLKRAREPRQNGRDDPAPTETTTTQNPTIQNPTIGSMVAYFKYQSTTRINSKHPTVTQKIWQRGYFDHIIRNRKSLFFIQQYIRNNPVNWEGDKNYSHTQEKIDDVISSCL